MKYLTLIQYFCCSLVTVTDHRLALLSKFSSAKQFRMDSDTRPNRKGILINSKHMTGYFKAVPNCLQHIRPTCSCISGGTGFKIASNSTETASTERQVYKDVKKS